MREIRTALAVVGVIAIVAVVAMIALNIAASRGWNPFK